MGFRDTRMEKCETPSEKVKVRTPDSESGVLRAWDGPHRRRTRSRTFFGSAEIVLRRVL